MSIRVKWETALKDLPSEELVESVKACDWMLGQFFIRGLHDAIRERRQMCVDELNARHYMVKA